MSVDTERKLEIPVRYELQVDGYDGSGPSKKLLDVRAAFVESKGWRPLGCDADENDLDPGTRHISSVDSEGQPIASLRITPVTGITESTDIVDSAEITDLTETSELKGVAEPISLTESTGIAKSLSFNMLQPHVQEKAGEAIDNGALPEGDFSYWDLTRLVVDINESPRNYVPEIARLLRLALDVSEEESEHEVIWIFAVDEEFEIFLKRNRIKVKRIATDENGGKTIFGYARPSEIKEKLESQKATSFGEIAVRHVQRGTV